MNNENILLKNDVGLFHFRFTKISLYYIVSNNCFHTLEYFELTFNIPRLWS